MRWLWLLMIGLIGVIAMGAPGAPDRLAAWVHDRPGITLHQASTALRLTGRSIAVGASARDAADRAIERLAPVLGVPRDELIARPWSDERVGMPLMRDRQTGEPRFVAMAYQQRRGGVDVAGGSMRVLMRREPGGRYTVVLMNPDVRDLGEFAVDHEALAAGLARHAGATPIIWAGRAGAAEPARAAVRVIRGEGATRSVYIIDAATESILDEQPLVHQHGASVEGSVSGLATDGIGSAACERETTQPMPHIRITGGDGMATFADERGEFMLDTAGPDITATLDGRWFDIVTETGPTAVLIRPIDGDTQFVFNQTNDDEFIRAQVNAHVELNRVREFVLEHFPDFPTLNEPGFPVLLNRIGGTCPNAAFYDSEAESINTCAAAGDAPNTTWSSILHHEFGHHLVQQSDSGQGRYGEGFSDCLAVLLADDPRIGVGFSGGCVPFRNADNDLQWPCNEPSIHFCGQLLSGSVWQTRQAMTSLHPDEDAVAVVTELLLASLFLHTGFDVSPAIYTDFLVLDDDDGDLSNGTPHMDAITAGFDAHNMVPVPPPANEFCETALDVTLGTVSGTTAGASSVHGPACANLGPDVWLRYVPAVDGELIVESCGSDFNTVLTIYDGCPQPGVEIIELDCNADTVHCEDDGAFVRAPVETGETYYVRVGGVGGQSGAFTLLLRGEPPKFDFPGGDVILQRPRPAEYVLPGEPIEFAVEIIEGIAPIDPDTAFINFRFDAEAPFLRTPLRPVPGEENLYTAVMPLIDCRARPQFYVEVTDLDGTTATQPDLLTSFPYRSFPGLVTTVVQDNFETDAGWMTSASPTTTSGFWQRGVPVADPKWPIAPMADSDGSGQCWMTQNELGNTDVDDGSVTLTSPVFDMSGDVILSYDYNTYIDQINGEDRLLVEASNNGFTWTKIATHSTRRETTWLRQRIFRGHMVAQGFFPGASAQLRFIASDEPDIPSRTEAAIDNLSIIRLDCDLELDCRADCTRDGVVGMDDIAAVLNAFGSGFGPCDIEPDNGDGSFGNDAVNIDDLLAVVRGFGECP